MNKDLHQLNELAQNTIVSTTISKNRLQRNIMRMKKVLHSTNATVKSIAMLLMGVLFFANSWGQLLSTSYASSSNWYTVASNCTMDTTAGSGLNYVGNNNYVSTSPKGQQFGTRSGTFGTSDGAGTTATANITAGKYSI